MKYTHCGIEFEGNFCPICGKAIETPKAQVHYENATNIQPMTGNARLQAQPTSQNAPAKDGKSESDLSLAFSIIGIIGLFFGETRLFSLAFFILGLIFSIIGRNKAISVIGVPHGTGTAGMVISIIGLVIILLIILSAFALLAACSSIGQYLLESL